MDLSKRELESEKLRNWHWMWSKFYFNKKHYGYLRCHFNKLVQNYLDLLDKIYFLFYTFNKFNEKNLYNEIFGTYVKFNDW